MKERPKGFLAQEKIGDDAFEYVRELHDYLWRIVRIVYPSASGSLNDYLGEELMHQLRTIAIKADALEDYKLLIKQFTNQERG